MDLKQAQALLQEGLIFMRHEVGRVPIPVWFCLEDSSVLSWRSFSPPVPPPPHSCSVALFNGARALDASDARVSSLLSRRTVPWLNRLRQALGPGLAVDAALVHPTCSLFIFRPICVMLFAAGA
jgi:hypothetical protein